MTWEQEMRIQVKEKSEQLAKIIAKEMVEDRVNAMRADIEKEAKDLAKEMVEDRVNAIRKDIENEAKEKANEIAEEQTAEKVEETARKMLAEKIAPEVVARCTGLSLEQVKKLVIKEQIPLKNSAEFAENIALLLQTVGSSKGYKNLIFFVDLQIVLGQNNDMISYGIAKNKEAKR